MRIVPVIDLKGGRVVRGMAGRREEYRPVVSRLTDSADPLDVARAFRDRLGLSELYVADLDAIAGAPPSLSLFAELHALGFVLWVDAGLREAGQARPLVESGVSGIVAGLETLAGPQELTRLCEQYGPRVLFSLDLKEGRPIGDLAAWRGDDPWSLAREAVERGVRHLLLLDLARVGVGAGTGTEDLARKLADAYPTLEVWAGGGVRGADDLRRLSRYGICCCLVASALHDGSLRRASGVCKDPGNGTSPGR